MPTVRRERLIEAGPYDVWSVLVDPERLPDWWPGVTRVEEATPAAWTKVFESSRKALRADYTRLVAEPPRRLVWRQEVEESPFERLLTESKVELLLEPEDGATLVRVVHRMRLRGFARFGVLQVRRATGRTLSLALDGLAGLTAQPRGR